MNSLLSGGTHSSTIVDFTVSFRSRTLECTSQGARLLLGRRVGGSSKQRPVPSCEARAVGPLAGLPMAIKFPLLMPHSTFPETFGRSMFRRAGNPFGFMTTTNCLPMGKAILFARKRASSTFRHAAHFSASATASSMFCLISGCIARADASRTTHQDTYPQEGPDEKIHAEALTGPSRRTRHDVFRRCMTVGMHHHCEENRTRKVPF